MGSPYHKLRDKNDRALVAYLVHLTAGTVDDTFPAKQSRDKALPCTICYSKTSRLIRNTGGNGTLEVAIIVKSLAPDDFDQPEGEAKAESEDRVGTVFDAFYTIEDGSAPTTKKIAAQITAAARAKGAIDAALVPPGPDADLLDYTCMDVRDIEEDGGFEEDGDAWLDTLNLEMDCAPSNVD